jgi:hypothetical protein
MLRCDVMAEAPLTRPGPDEETTPPTRSYVDQLLKGNMSPSEISTLRAEISESPEDDEARTILRAPEPLPAGFGDEDDVDSGGQTAVHVYSPDELAREAELRRRAALRAPVITPPRRAPASTMPPAPSSRPGRSSFESAPPGPAPLRSVPPASPSSRSVPPASPSSRSVPPASPSRSVPPAARSVPPAAPVSPSVPPPTGRSVTQAFLRAIGGNDGILKLAVPAERLTELQLKHEAGFVLSRIDGMTSIEDMLDLSPLGRAETLRILHELLQSGVLRVEARP